MREAGTCSNQREHYMDGWTHVVPFCMNCATPPDKILEGYARELEDIREQGKRL